MRDDLSRKLAAQLAERDDAFAVDLERDTEPHHRFAMAFLAMLAGAAVVGWSLWITGCSAGGASRARSPQRPAISQVASETMGRASTVPSAHVDRAASSRRTRPSRRAAALRSARSPASSSSHPIASSHSPQRRESLLHGVHQDAQQVAQHGHGNPHALGSGPGQMQDGLARPGGSENQKSLEAVALPGISWVVRFVAGAGFEPATFGL